MAAEHVGAYDAIPPDPSTSEEAPQDEPPFGLPVLAEVPALAAVLDRLSAADGALLDAVAGLADLLADDTVEEVTGVGIEHWLAAITAQTRMDRRLLVRMCRLLRRLPTLHAAVRDHRLSFAQLRGLTIGLRDARKELDQELDRLVGALLDELGRLQRPDPDVLVRQVVDALDELARSDLEAREQEAANSRFLHLQPHRDGTGGRLVAEVDAAGLALLDAATIPSAAAVEAAGGHGAARIDALLARVAGSVPPAGADENGDPSSEGTSSSDWADALAAPKLLIRLPFHALFEDRLPADLLTTLTGGRLRLTSQAARRLVDRAGARLRAVVVDDDGTVVGVGRATRQPPGFLSDALASIHDTCTGPGCDRPARGVETDHARPWWPTRPDTQPGTTDLDNLGPLCARTNRAKESAGWQVSQRISGTRTWVHPLSGLTTTTVPSTWRSPNDPRRRPPPRAAPPGPIAPGPIDAADAPPETSAADGPDDLPF